MVKVLEDSSRFKKFYVDIGRKTTLSLFFVLILSAGLLVTISQLNKQQDVRQHAATPVSNRILWQGQNWYVNGVNVPWYNWACDFGCNASNGRSGGVSTNNAALTVGFDKVRDSGMHVLRWWVFPGDPWQITRNATGPTGIDPAVYVDFDAALALAEQYDFYYDFVLFSHPTGMPIAWQTDPAQRTRLVNALGTLFAHYRNHPRILSWEVYNEPENDIWNNRIAQQPVVDTGTAIAASVHANSPETLVTVGSLIADGMKMWLNAGLDYYSPHWYDYMNGGDYCMICHNYAFYSAWGVNKPIVIGEFYTGVSSTSPYSSSFRNNYWYDNGYAGAWAWSLFHERTADLLAVDFAAEKTFNQAHIAEVGPVSGGSFPTSTPTVAVPTNTPVPTFPTVTPTRTPTPVPPTPTPTRTPTPTSSQPTPTPTVTFTIGDINRDNKIDAQDLSYMLSNWGTNNTFADLNNSGIIDAIDLSILLSNWKP